MHGLARDFEHFLRQTLRRPVWSLSIVLVLGLGIGANTAMFSAFDAWVMRPLDFEDPERLVVLSESQPEVGRYGLGVSPLNLDDWKERLGSFEAIGAFSRVRFNLEDVEEPARLDGVRVDANLFPLLGVAPILGRQLTPEDDRPGTPAAVVLIGHRLWRERFAGTPDVLGKTLRLDGRSHEIVGVMQEGFAFPEWAEVWTPLALDADAYARDARWLNVFGRLRTGISGEEASAELGAIAADLERLHPQFNQDWSAHTRPLRDLWVPPVIEVALAASLGAGLLVLLVICANVASLMLAQASARSREMALRTALGASRWRLARQTFLESGLLALVGGVVGAVLGALYIHRMLSWAPIDPPYLFAMQLDLRGWIYTLAVALLAGSLCALLPVLRSTGLRMYEELRSGGRNATGPNGAARLRSLLVVGELGLSTALLIGALLLVKSFLEQQAFDPGYRIGGLTTMELSFDGAAFGSEVNAVAVIERLRLGLEGTVGVDSVAFTSRLPVSGGYALMELAAEGTATEHGEGQRAGLFSVTAEYFEALALRRLAGRTFTPFEVLEGGDAAIVSAELARRLWGAEQDAVGRRLRDLRRDDDEWLTVVGVVKDVASARDMVVDANHPDVQIYRPYGAVPFDDVTVVVASDREPAFLARRVREELRRAGMALPTGEVLTMAEVILREQWVTRMFSRMLGLYALIALAVAAVGIYGLIADSVSRRGHEIAVRMAMGAGHREVMGLIVGQGVKLAVVGVGLGVVLSLATTRFGASMLMDVSPRDPLIFAAVSLVLLATCLLASYLPSRRAAGIDPAPLLRSE